MCCNFATMCCKIATCINKKLFIPQHIFIQKILIATSSPNVPERHQTTSNTFWQYRNLHRQTRLLYPTRHFCISGYYENSRIQIQCDQWRSVEMSFGILWGLFFSAFVAASIFPAQSELFLAGALAKQSAPVWAIIGAASLGNTLGSATNWLLGRFFLHYQNRRWFPIDRKKLAKAEAWYGKYGRWSLLLSWTPFVGDPITLVAGILREPFSSFIVIVAVAKTLRYVVVALITLQFA